MCGLVVETDGPHITSIRGDKDDHFSRGHICPKAVALQDLHEDPDRLRKPVKRVGDSWQEINWDEAFTLVAQGLRRVQKKHGDNSVAVYLGNPTVHSLGAMFFAPAFVRSLKTRNRYSATSVDQLPHHLAALWMFGHPLLIPIPDLDRTDHLLILGANPAASNGSLMTAPDAANRLKEIRRRGGRVVLIDPRRTETAELADAHHFIQPGGDALLLLSMLHVLFAERLTRTSRTTPFTDGAETLEAIAARFAPERVAAHIGMDANVIRELAHGLAAAKQPAAYGRIGVSTQEFGGLACWLISALNTVMGRMDEPGGVMFTRPAVDLIRGGLYSSAKFARWKSRVRGLPEFAGELPVSALTEEMDTPGEGQVRALVTHAGNPVLSTPNGARLDRAMAGLEFYAAIDFYINETTRHAHVILPPTAALERDHYDLVFHVFAVRNTAKFSEAIFPKPDGARHDWEILLELATRMARGGLLTRLRARGAALIARRMGPRGILRRALRAGPWASTGLTLDKLQREPHGVDLGALESCFPERLRTADKRIQLAPAPLVADVVRLESSLDSRPAPRPSALDSRPFSLIGRRDLRSNNSWMHNSNRLVRGKRRCTVLMHEADARAQGLTDGEQVRVSSSIGQVQVELETTDSMMPGVVSLPHGWGHGKPGTRLTVSNAHAGASINDLTDDARIDALTGNAGFNGVRVRVDRA